MLSRTHFPIEEMNEIAHGNALTGGKREKQKRKKTTTVPGEANEFKNKNKKQIKGIGRGCET